MRVLIWKKLVELKRAPMKIIVVFLLPVLGSLLYLYKFRFSFGQVFSLFPLIITCFSTLVLFNIEELSYMTFYVALGINVRKVWMSNLLFLLLFNYIYTDVYLILLKSLLRESITFKNILDNILLIPVAFFMLGMSTIHYLSYSKGSIIVASVFSIFNIFAPAVIFVYKFPVILFADGIVLSFAVSLIGICGMLWYMRNSRNEVLCENTKDIVNGYHEKFFTED